MTFTHALSTNNYGPAKFIVSASVAEGTHTTIGAALTSASSGDTIFIRPGTYTENLTLKAGVNLVAYNGDSETPNVTIIGNSTFTAAGTVSLGNIRLQTNSAALLTVSGSAASIVNLNNCYLNCSNNTGISFSTSSSSAKINAINCRGDIGTTGIALFASSSAGTLKFDYCSFSNSGGSSTASTISAGVVLGEYCSFTSPITSSGTANNSFFMSTFSTAAQNVTSLTSGGSSATNTAKLCLFFSGTASAVSIGSNLTMVGCEVNTSNTNAITGAGTLTYTPINFSGTSKLINTTTQTPLNFGTFTPTVIGGSVAGTTTYTTQAGFYTIVGNIVLVEANIVITGATGTGNATFGALPFTIKNISNYACHGVARISATGWAWPAGTTSMQSAGLLNTTNLVFTTTGTLSAGGVLQMANAAATFFYSMWYQI